MDEIRKAVMGIFVNYTNEVLIGKSPRDKAHKFPQGGLDIRETPYQGLEREVQEELGFKITTDDVLMSPNEKVMYYYPDTFTREKDYIGQEQTVFKIQYNPQTMIIKPNNIEFTDMLWVRPEDIKRYDVWHRGDAYVRALELCDLL